MKRVKILVELDVDETKYADEDDFLSALEKLIKESELYVFNVEAFLQE